MTAFDSTRGWETPRMSFIVNRPQNEPGFALDAPGRPGPARSATRIRAYATDKPEGERYG